MVRGLPETIGIDLETHIIAHALMDATGASSRPSPIRSS
jgi:hypothetical protein